MSRVASDTKRAIGESNSLQSLHSKPDVSADIRTAVTHLPRLAKDQASDTQREQWCVVMVMVVVSKLVGSGSCWVGT